MTKKLYKFLRTGLKSESGNEKWQFGKWKKFNGDLEMCQAGFHCSLEPYDAFSYVQGEILAEVEVRGESLKQKDKQVWEEMRIVRAWKWTKKDSVKLAIFSAEQVIGLFEKEYPNDKRPREAIRAAKRWLKNPSRKNRAAARDAWDAAWAAAWAVGAAWAAAWAVGDAAWAAVGAAAGDAWAAGDAAWAARAAAGDAAWAAGAADAAGDAMIKKIQKKFVRMTKELEPYQRNKWVK